MYQLNNTTELSSHEETRCQFNGGKACIKLGIDVHQDFYVVVMQEEGSNPKPPQRFGKEAFLYWAARLKEKRGAEIYAVYEACGFGFALQRRLSALSIQCYVVCPQKLDERNKRVKTDSLDAKALCLRLDRFVQGNKEALALVRVPTEEEEQARAIQKTARAIGQSTQAIGSSGTQFDGQSRDRAGEEVVEGAQLCCAASAHLDERVTLQQSTDPGCAPAKDQRIDAPSAKRRGRKTTARTGVNE
jgi:transposase